MEQVAGSIEPHPNGLNMNLRELDDLVAYYKGNSFALNTKRAYQVHRKTYIAFCNGAGVNPVPANTLLLCRYAAFLAKRLKFSSIKQYFNIIRLLHAEWGLPNPCQNNYQLSCTMKGIKRHLGNAVSRKSPITPQLLRRIQNNLDLSTPRGANVWAVCTLMFFGLLRKSNVLVVAEGKFNPALHLRRRDLIFTKEGLKVYIRWSKTNQFQERERILPFPWKRGHPFCPTQAVYQAVRLTRGAQQDGPAFVVGGAQGSPPLTATVFQNDLRRALQGASVNVADFAGHSFRRGGALWGFKNQLSIEALKHLGHWQSSAYANYFIPTEEGLAESMATMLDRCPP